MPDPRQAALDLLADFERRMLPTALRRLSQWKGFHARRQVGVVEDLRQELVVDALSHAHELSAMPPRAVHARWFRLVQSVHYRLCVRATRRDAGVGDDLDSLPGRAPDGVSETAPDAAPDAAPGSASGDPRRLDLDRVASAAVHLQNGRLNAIATAERLGLTKREFRQLWERLTDALGFGEDYVDFWRARLREAGTRLAIDLLRASGALHTFGTADLGRIDPAAHVRRIRRVRVALSSHPHRRDSKHVFVEALSRRSPDPIALFDAVADLADRPSAARSLWQFEAALLFGDLDGATRHLREATTNHDEGEEPRRTLRVPRVLACARLLEARGEPRRAIDRLRSAQRNDADERLQASLRSLESGLDRIE